MKQFLLNLWNAQKTAASLCAMESRHEWLTKEYTKVSAESDAMEEERDAVIELALTLSVGYRAALGNPADKAEIPVCIQEAHALRGRHTKWKFKVDKDFGALFTEKAVKNEAARVAQYKTAGLEGWKGWGK